ncbi:MAG: HAMP domain-containing histidine kinase [Phaeodactylibacter sp.]|nr:HAMP domain-containing histidine kinase [Phaeodactylibacter sp.]
MKQLQFSRWSAGMVVLNLALLAAFLFFWLRKEYQSEKGRLEQAAHLQIADRVIEFTGLDLDSILQNIQGGDSLIAIKVVSGKGLWASSVLGDTVVDPGAGTKKVRMPFRAEHKMVDWKNDLTPGDSLTTSISIVMTAEDTSELNAMRKAMDFSVQLRDEFNSTTEDLSGQALWNILPQGLFALGLFSISILTIVVLRRTFTERQRLLQSKNTMISNITHELKTPVATIGVALEAIQDFNAQANPAKADAYMTTARGELHRLAQSIDQILQFSQMDQGAMAFHFEPVSFKELLQKSVQSMKLQLEQRQSDFDLLLQGADCRLDADQLHHKNAINS